MKVGFIVPNGPTDEQLERLAAELGGPDRVAAILSRSTSVTMTAGFLTMAFATEPETFPVFREWCQRQAAKYPEVAKAEWVTPAAMDVLLAIMAEYMTIAHAQGK